jgi:acyl-CoA synthetase (AMP-forming)/AMP-acid ligase II
MTAMDALALLASAAARRPRGAAVRCGRRELSYPDLADLARHIGESLERAGARSGDRVAALLPNCHLYLACYFGALQAGHVLVPLNTRLAQAELRAVLDHSGARALFGDPGRVASLAAPGPSAEGEGWMVAPVVPGSGRADGGREGGRPPAGAAHLYYTSGTTGAPKGVILTRGNLIAHVRMTLEELAFREEDVWLHAAPMFHLADAWAVWTATAAAATHVVLPRFEPAAAFDLIETAGVTITNLVPVMLLGLLKEAERRRRRLPSLRLLLSGGAPIAPGVVGRIGPALGCAYAQTYGLTETSPFLTFSLPDAGPQRRSPLDVQARDRARAGRPARGVEVRVVLPIGAEPFEDVPADDATVGEVVARGPTVTPGYWRDPQATAEAFRGGWFHTGDLGTIDGRGSINLVDRAKDVIITGGETVYSTDVEHALHEHPAVGEAAAFGVPDEKWGEAVRAAVVLKDRATATGEDLIAFCRDRIAFFKCPRAIDFTAALPRTVSGKIDKKVLRGPFWGDRPRRVN